MSYISIAVAIAGLIHIWLGPQHYLHAPVHGIFFVVIGLVQLIWAYVYNRQSHKRPYKAGLFLTGGLIVLWGITRVVDQPFHGHAGSVDLEGILCKLAELIGLIGLAQAASVGKIKDLPKRSFASVLSSAVLISVATGFLTYGIAVAAEQVLPQSGEHAGHSEGHEDGHGGEHEEHTE